MEFALKKEHELLRNLFDQPQSPLPGVSTLALRAGVRRGGVEPPRLPTGS